MCRRCCAICDVVLHESLLGGGGSGFAFALDSDFYTGQTSSSATFNNDPLVSSEDHCFGVKNVEVWKLDSCI